MAILAGRLLIATPTLLDPNFARAVVLLLDHDDDGAIGVVLNRPSELPLVAVLPQWSEAVTTPAQLFSGGPVSPESAVAVGVHAGTAGVDLDGFRPLGGGFGLVDLDTEPEPITLALDGMRVFSGYAGWGSEQLQAEIAEGSWYVVSAATSDLLDPDPETLWRSILRRQPGELAYVANFPDDPTMN